MEDLRHKDLSKIKWGRKTNLVDLKVQFWLKLLEKEERKYIIKLALLYGALGLAIFGFVIQLLSGLELL